MNFAAKMTRSTQRMSIGIHVAGCACLNMHGKKAATWGLDAATVGDAIAEVAASEDAEARGIKVKAAPCAK